MTQFLRFPELKEHGIPWSRMHVDRLEKAGRFPRRVHLSPRTVVWLKREIDAFIASKLANRDYKPAPAKSSPVVALHSKRRK
jgi:prophage regulatory protein